MGWTSLRGRDIVTPKDFGSFLHFVTSQRAAFSQTFLCEVKQENKAMARVCRFISRLVTHCQEALGPLNFPYMGPSNSTICIIDTHLMWVLDFKLRMLAEICHTLLYKPKPEEETKTKSLQPSSSLTFDLLRGPSSLNLQRNWRKRTHPELIDFPQTAAPPPRFMDSPGTSAASVCQ